MVVTGGPVQRDTSSRSDFITNNQRCKKRSVIFQMLGLRERQKRGKHAAPDMAFGQLVPIMGVQRVDCDTASKRGPARTDQPSIKQHCNLVLPWSKMFCSVVTHNAGHVSVRRPSGDAKQIE